MTHHIYITGGASGIGEAAVRRFAAEGWKVTFSDINTAAGDALAAELGADVLFVKADTRRREEIAAAAFITSQLTRYRNYVRRRTTTKIGPTRVAISPLSTI